MGCGIEIVKARDLIRFLDTAYPGFGASMDGEDSTLFAPLPAPGYLR